MIYLLQKNSVYFVNIIIHSNLFGATGCEMSLAKGIIYVYDNILVGICVEL